METVPAQVGLQGGARCVRLKLCFEKISWQVRNTFLSIFSMCTNTRTYTEAKNKKGKKKNQLIHISWNYLHPQLQVLPELNRRFQELQQELGYQAHPSLQFSSRKNPDFSPLALLLSVGSAVAAEPSPGEWPGQASCGSCIPASARGQRLGWCRHRGLEIQQDTRNGHHRQPGQSRPLCQGPCGHAQCRQRCRPSACSDNGTEKKGNLIHLTCPWESVMLSRNSFCILEL